MRTSLYPCYARLVVTGHLETLPRMNEWKEDERGQRTKKGNKESGENKGLRKEAGNDESHSNSHPLESRDSERSFLR